MHTDFYVDKTSQTYADVLTTFGLARVIQELMFQQNAARREIRIQDKGNYYHISCQPGVDENRLEFLRTNSIVLVKAIPTTFYNEEKQPEGIPLVNWNEVTEYLNAVKSKGDSLPPRPEHLDILLTINPEAIQGYNSLLFRWWIVRECQPEIFRLLFDLYGSTPNDVEAAAADWKKLAKIRGWKYAPKISGQQLYNPDQGEGQNQPKANKLETRKKPDINFWLTEWLRTVGFYQVAMPRLVGDEKTRNSDKDRKILVIAPRDISFGDSSIIMEKFQRTMLPDTAIRFDLFAVIRYLQTLLAYYAEPAQQHRLRSLGSVKRNLVAGFFSAFYKKMGKGRTLMNMSFLSFPGWIEVYSEQDVRIYRNLLDELGRLVRQFDESRGEEVTLLQHLRDFLSGDNLEAFFRFTNAFPAYLMSTQQKGKWPKRLATEFIERLIMSTDRKLSEILQNEGFRNIAYAIRQSTVLAQYWSQSEKGRYPYDVRYGLWQELSRRSRQKEGFVADLTSFLQKYSAETAQVEENMRKRGVKFPFPHQRKNVRTTDIDEIVALIDEFGSETVANLLIAYGYARDPREEGAPELEAETPETTDEEEFAQ